MAYSRFIDSDIYIYASTLGYITCSGCSLSELDGRYTLKSINLYTDKDILEHIARHRAKGDLIPEGLEDEILSDKDRFTPWTNVDES